MNDERPIEKLLRRYGKKRRDAAGTPELHPATRRLLHGEVARQYQRPSGGGAPSFLAVLKNWMPWFAGSVAVLAVAGLSAWMFFAGQEQTIAIAPSSAPGGTVQLAKNEPTSATETIPGDLKDSVPAENSRNFELPTAAAVPADNAPTLASAESSARRARTEFDSALPAPSRRAAVLSDESSIRKDSLNVASAPARTELDRRQKAATPSVNEESVRRNYAEVAAVAPPATVPVQAAQEKSKVSADTAKAEVRVARERALNPPPGSAPVARGGGLERERAPDYAQSFANRTPLTTRAEKAFKSDTDAPVLLNFQVEQTGNRLVVIDKDGSIYRGEVSPQATYGDDTLGAAGGVLTKLPATRTATKLTEAKEAKMQNYFYRVSGTNQTLQQPVVFSWNFISPTNGLSAVRQTPAVSGAFANERQNAPYPQNVSASNATINGRVELEGREIEINAVPVVR